MRVGGRGAAAAAASHAHGDVRAAGRGGGAAAVRQVLAHARGVRSYAVPNCRSFQYCTR